MDANKIWLQLRRSGRLPDLQLDAWDAMRLEVTLWVWLGDYSTALKQCTEPALHSALERFVASLPQAEAASFAFFPRKSPRLQPDPRLANIKTKCGTYKTGDGTDVGYVHLFPSQQHAPATKPPALLVRWGGNAEMAALVAFSPFCEFVASGLLHIMFVDYRGYGWSAGSPSLETFRSDADTFYSALPTLLTADGLQWPLARPLILMGRSIGAHCALHVALLHADEVSALVLDSPASCHWPMENIPGDVWNLLNEQLPPLKAVGRKFDHCQCCRFDDKQALRERAWLDPTDLLHCVDMPLLLINGTADTVCPQPQVEQFFQASTAMEKDLVWIAGKGHNEVSGTDTYWRSLKSFLERFVHGMYENMD